MEEKSTFHAGREFTPLGNGTTRVRTFADGGALLSDEILPDAEALKLIGQPIPWGSDVYVNPDRQPDHSDSSEHLWWHPSGEQ